MRLNQAVLWEDLVVGIEKQATELEKKRAEEERQRRLQLKAEQMAQVLGGPVSPC